MFNISPILCKKTLLFKVIGFLLLVLLIWLVCSVDDWSSVRPLYYKQHHHLNNPERTWWMVLLANCSPNLRAKKFVQKDNRIIVGHGGDAQINKNIPLQRKRHIISSATQNELKRSKEKSSAVIRGEKSDDELLAEIISYKLKHVLPHYPDIENRTFLCAQRAAQPSAYPSIVNFVRFVSAAPIITRSSKTKPSKKIRDFITNSTTPALLPALTFDFLHFVAIISVERFLQPSQLNIFTNSHDASGIWLELARKFSPCLQIRTNTTLQRRLGGGQRVRYIQHEADFIKVREVAQHGGLSLDLDVFILNGTKLRAAQAAASECVLSSVHNVRGASAHAQIINGGFLSCAANSSFAELWLRSYATHYKANSWGYNQGIYPHLLWEKYDKSEAVILNGEVSNNPRWDEKRKWLQPHGVENWREKPAAHHFIKLNEILFAPSTKARGRARQQKNVVLNGRVKSIFELLASDSSFGEMLRYITNVEMNDLPD